MQWRSNRRNDVTGLAHHRKFAWTWKGICGGGARIRFPGSRDCSQHRRLAELKDKYGDLVLPLSLDVTSKTQACEAVNATIRTFGKLDVLVNNVGYGNVAPIEDTTLEDFRAQIETNLFGVIILNHRRRDSLPDPSNTKTDPNAPPRSPAPEAQK
jgi:NAD(P)-dependent dehydrogenase (short-subunit alcohol dehydrogenase family)